MVDNATSHSVSNFLNRRHSTGNGLPQQTISLPPYPPSTPDHVCREFSAPEGVYTLGYSIFVNSMQPLYSVGTRASLISTHTHKNEQQQPGARTFRNMFSHHTNQSNTDSEEDHQINRTPSLSSSSSSHKINTGTPLSQSTIVEDSTIKINNHSEPSLTSTPTPNTSTLSFLARNHTLGRHHHRKPKTSITKSNSSFVQKIIANDQLNKILAARTSNDMNIFYNCGTSFLWVDAAGHPKEPLSRIIFAKACPTSHDVNVLTRSVDHLDIIIGFTSGDIIWFNPLCSKYARINKGSVMNSSPITDIKWVKGSQNLFMAAFHDGSVMIFDKDKEDEPFHPGDTNDDDDEKNVFKVSKPTPKLASKHNPVSHWKLSNKSITAFEFSPDCQHVAIVGLDGILRVINIWHELMFDVYESYYGGLLCVTWSPDGKYILTGGQDDLVTIWDFREQRIIARCQGHKSWVTGIAFDPWRCDKKVYRFGSVGEDAKLILWDFSVSALHRPKKKPGNRNRGISVSSLNTPPPSSIYTTMQDRPPVVHPVLSKTEVAFLQPTVIKTIHGDPCVGIYFREDIMVTTDKRGRVSVWKRPVPTPTNLNSSHIIQ